MAGGIVLREFRTFTPFQAAAFPLAVALVLAGLWCLPPPPPDSPPITSESEQGCGGTGEGRSGLRSEGIGKRPDGERALAGAIEMELLLSNGESEGAALMDVWE